MGRKPVPHFFFKTWTADMAYVLGYWWADGNMRARPKELYRVSFSSKDQEHLEVIARVIGGAYYMEQYKLAFSSKDMYNDLVALGGTERKSLTAVWHTVPETYLAHFVRGYIDGDGHLGWDNSKGCLRPKVNVAGTNEFLCGMSTAIENATGISITTHFKQGNIWHAVWSSIKAKCLIIWTHQHHKGLALSRKATIAEEIVAWKPKYCLKRSITPKMCEMFGLYLPEMR